MAGAAAPKPALRAGAAGGEDRPDGSESDPVVCSIRAGPPSTTAELVRRIIQACGGTAAGFLASCALHALAGRFLRPAIARLAPKDRAAGAQLPVSTVHALAVGTNALLLLLGGHFDGDAMWTRWSRRLAANFAFSAGYSLQDMVVMLRQRETAEMWLHHAVVFAGSFFMLLMRQASFFPTAFHVTELSVVAHNLSWYFRKLGADTAQPSAYRAIQHLRLGTFLLFRTIVGPYVLWRFANAPRAGPRAAACHPLTRHLAGFNVLFLTLLNSAWTVGLIHAVRREIAGVGANAARRKL